MAYTRTTAVVEADPVEDARAPDLTDRVGEAEAVDPLYPVALLKIAMRMKRLGPGEEIQFEALMDDVLTDMVVDRADFARYLETNRARLTAAVRKRGY